MIAREMLFVNAVEMTVPINKRNSICMYFVYESVILPAVLDSVLQSYLIVNITCAGTSGTTDLGMVLF